MNLGREGAILFTININYAIKYALFDQYTAKLTTITNEMWLGGSKS